jgi:hypothetical protein
MAMHVELGDVVPEDVAPENVAFGVLVGLSVGWTGGSVLTGAPLSNVLPLLATLLGAGAALYVAQSRG